MEFIQFIRFRGMLFVFCKARDVINFFLFIHTISKKPDKIVRLLYKLLVYDIESSHRQMFFGFLPKLN